MEVVEICGAAVAAHFLLQKTAANDLALATEDSIFPTSWWRLPSPSLAEIPTKTQIGFHFQSL